MPAWVTLYETPCCMLRDIQCPGGRSVHEWYALHTFGLPMTSKWAAPMASARVTTSRATRMNTGPLASHKVHVKPPSWKATACPAITRRSVEPVSGTAPERYGYHGHREPRATAAGACVHSMCAARPSGTCPAFALVAGGLLELVVSGCWTARSLRVPEAHSAFMHDAHAYGCTLASGTPAPPEQMQLMAWLTARTKRSSTVAPTSRGEVQTR